MEATKQHNELEQSVGHKAAALKNVITKLVAERDSLYLQLRESQAHLEQLRKSYHELDNKRKEVHRRLEYLHSQIPPQ